MVKKLQKMAGKKAAPAANGFNPAHLLDGQIAQNVRDSAQQIWAAGLAAFSKTQGEGGKVFDALVKEGMSLQKKTQNLAEQKFGAVASKMSGMATEVGSKAGQQWDKLESIFEERVARALKSLGVPSGKDIGSLIARIDALSAAVGFAPSKKASKPAAKSSKPTKKAEAKPAAKKAAPKKAEAAKPAAKPVAKKPAAAKPAAKPVAKKAEAKAPAKRASAPRKAAAKPALAAAPAAEAAQA